MPHKQALITSGRTETCLTARRRYVKLAPGDKDQLELEPPDDEEGARILVIEALGEVPRHELRRPEAEKGVVSWQGFPAVLTLSFRLMIATSSR
jgi:hypothetical protein